MAHSISHSIEEYLKQLNKFVFPYIPQSMKKIQPLQANILRQIGSSADKIEDLQEQIDNLPTGGGEGASFYQHTQSIPNNTWIITHNLGYFPNVAVADSSGRQVIGDVTYTNVNTVTLSFGSAFSGKAYLS